MLSIHVVHVVIVAPPGSRVIIVVIIAPTGSIMIIDVLSNECFQLVNGCVCVCVYVCVPYFLQLGPGCRTGMF